MDSKLSKPLTIPVVVIAVAVVIGCRGGRRRYPTAVAVHKTAAVIIFVAEGTYAIQL